MPSRLNLPRPMSSWILRHWLGPIPEGTTEALEEDGADDGDRNSSQVRAERRRTVRAALDAMFGTASPSAGVATEASAPGEPSEPGPATEAPTEVPAPVPAMGEPEGEPDGGPIPEHQQAFWSIVPLRCEGCFRLPPHEYEEGLPPWQEGFPKSHQYALLINANGSRLPCFSREVRESVRWHNDHPGQRPRTTRWWCIACNYQNVQDREEFIEPWSWKNEQLGNDSSFRGVKDFVVNQFFWPRHVEFPPHELETMAWPETDGDNTP